MVVAVVDVFTIFAFLFKKFRLCVAGESNFLTTDEIFLLDAAFLYAATSTHTHRCINMCDNQKPYSLMFISLCIREGVSEN